MNDPFGTEKGTPIRMPSTANLMVSSYDKVGGLGTTAGNFGIAASQSLLNGFFTRIAPTELALNWNISNVVADNSGVRIDISGVGIQTFLLPIGAYTCADALDTLVSVFNAQSGGGRTIAITSTGAVVTITMTGGAFRFPLANNNLIGRLNFNYGGIYRTAQSAETSGFIGASPAEQLQPILWLDFVSDQLTYNQALKDGTTDASDRNVLMRFYMNYDNDMNQVDKYGYSIRLGMKPFFIRRTYSPPKQIKWYPNQPVGQIFFQVYARDVLGNSYLYDVLNYEWAMTLQVSEV